VPQRQRFFPKHFPVSAGSTPLNVEVLWKEDGGGVPPSDYVRGVSTGPLAPMVDDLLMDGRLADRGVFEGREVERLWREHRSGARDHRHRLWSLVMLELWFRQFVDHVRRPLTVGVAA